MKCGMMYSGTILTNTKEFLEIDMILSYINKSRLNVLYRDERKSSIRRFETIWKLAE